MITDEDDALAWSRDEHRGWGVGLYPPDSEYDSECIAFDTTADGGVPALLSLAEAVLRQVR